MVIYKYPVHFSNSPQLRLPEGAQFLSAQMQGRQMCIWAIVNTDARLFEIWRLRIVGTGLPDCFDNLKHLATVQDGEYVWHLFREH